MSRVFCALPRPWAMALGRGFAWVWYHLIPVRRGVARQNVERVFGDSLSKARKRQIVRGCFTNLCLYAVEALRFPILTQETSEALVELEESVSYAHAALARGRGIIAVTAHIGNFDLIGTGLTVRGYPIHAILKDISWRQAQLFLTKVRQATKLGRVAPRGSRETIKKLLSENQIVAFLIDQHLPPHRAIVCEFFGQLAATSPAPIKFAMQTGATILPAVIVRQDLAGHHRVHVEPPFELESPYESDEANIRHNTERLNRILEGWIRAYPEQWLWLHKRWKVQDAPGGWEVPASLQHLVAKSAPQ